MKSSCTAALSAIALMSLLLTACGEKTVGVSGADKLTQSQTCIDCHQGHTSPGTGNSIVDEWKLSVHNLNNGAGCADCHEPENGHPTGCNRCHAGTPSGSPDSTNHVSTNPDRDGKCAKCHGNVSGVFRTTTYDGISNDVKYLHYSTGKHANFVATNYRGYCRKCHNPHNTTSGREERQQWSRSGHGDTTSPARTSVDFKTRGSALLAENNFGNYCVRCHTSTGYINYVSSGFSKIEALPDLDGVKNNYPTNARPTYQDTSRELTGCNVCHSDGRSTDESGYSYRLRSVPQVFAYFNYSSTPTHQRVWDVKKKQDFPDYGSSNICVVCHSGREIGLIISIASANGLDFSSKQSRISAHDRVAASTLSGFSGFHFYSSAKKYAKPSYFQHDKIGTAQSNPANAGGSNGPCIGCHMKNSLSHFFLPIRESGGTITEIVSNAQVCSNCHNTANPFSFAWTPTLLEEKKSGLSAALASLKQMILRPNQNTANKLGVQRADGSLNYADSTVFKTGQWSKPFGNAVVQQSGNPLNGNASDAITAGAYTMGAAFNYEMILGDPGAYAHNSVYVRRLIFDSLDWLFDGSIDGDNSTKNAKAALDYLKAQGLITSGTQTSEYEMALAYLCEAQGDPTGSQGKRP